MMLSDFLHVKESSIKDYFQLIEIDFIHLQKNEINNEEMTKNEENENNEANEDEQPINIPVNAS